MTASLLRRISLVPPRLLVLCLLSACMLLIPTYVLLRPSFDNSLVHNSLWAPGGVQRSGAVGIGQNSPEVEALLKSSWTQEEQIADLNKHGGVIMPKLGNATAKAELGRASWKLLHTMAARFPEQPTESEREAFKSFIYLFSRLYPCGECAAHFQKLLRESPPQTSSQGAASLWLCDVHNKVNLRLDKEEFDCSVNLEGVYDCGCAEDPVGEEGNLGTAKKSKKVKEGMKRDPVTGLDLMGG